MEQVRKEFVTDEKAKKIALHVSGVSVAGNVLLSLFKLLAGIIGHSGAMISDAVHSASDVFGTIIAVLGISISKRKSDANHQYGLECVAAIVLAVILLATGLGIGISGVEKIIKGNSKGAAIPGVIALVAAVVSIVFKEWMYWYTRAAAKKINSGALMAEAWHHRSDAFSSIGTLIGISGAMFLGERWRVLDPITSLVVGIFIFGVAYKLARPSIQELLEMSLPEEVEQNIAEKIQQTPGVIAFHHLRTRKNGNTFIIDMHIKVDPDSSIVKAHDIATQVEESLKTTFGKRTQVNIHIEPYLQKN